MRRLLRFAPLAVLAACSRDPASAGLEGPRPEAGASELALAGIPAPVAPGSPASVSSAPELTRNQETSTAGPTSGNPGAGDEGQPSGGLVSPCRSSEDCAAPQVCAESADGARCVPAQDLPVGFEALPPGPAGQPAPPVGMLEGLRRLQTKEAPQ